MDFLRGLETQGGQPLCLPVCILHTKFLRKEVYSKRKEFAPPFRVDPV